MVFNFTVRGDKITPDEEYLFTEGNKGSYEAVFDFGEEWDELAKLCIVRSGDKKYSIPIFGNCCLLPELSKSSAKIGVVGVDALNEELVTRISTNMLGIGVQRGAYDEETAQELDTAAQVWEQYLTEMEASRKAAEAAKEEAVGAKENAETAAKNAATSKENSETSAKAASDAAADARAKADSVLGMTADAVTLAEGSEATVEKSEADGIIHLRFAIPRGQTGKTGAKGDKGEKGDTFTYEDLTEEQKAELLVLALPDIEAANKAAENASVSEENAKTSEEAAERSKTEAAYSATEAQSHADKAYNSSAEAAQSEETASQALSDLLAMINSGDLVLATAGKLPLSAIPATATQEIYTVSSEDELTILTAQRGDLAELIEEVDGEQTITKTWQCLGDASVRANWVVWGTSFAVQSGNATTADNALNANMINNHRVVEMTEEDFVSAVKDADTYYLVY